MPKFNRSAQTIQHLHAGHQELEPWTSTMTPAELHGIGPMAIEAEHSYQQLQNLVAAISNTQNAYQKLSLGNAQGEGKVMLPAMPDIQVKRASLKQQQQLLPVVQQRLSTSIARQPQRADL